MSRHIVPTRSDDLSVLAQWAERDNHLAFLKATGDKVIGICSRIERLAFDARESVQPGQLEALLAEADRQVALLGDPNWQALADAWVGETRHRLQQAEEARQAQRLGF